MKNKPTLKDLLLEAYCAGKFLCADDIWNFFQPHLKKQPKKQIIVPDERVKEYRELWPEIKFPSGKYARVNEKNLKNAFVKFFREFPEFENEWDLILEATDKYLEEFEKKAWLYASTSQYFIIKTMKDGSERHELANWIDVVIHGTGETRNKGAFEPKLY